MKKALVTVAALGLVAGVASNAAAVDFSVKGKYMLEGYSISDTTANTAGVDLAGPSDSDAYWVHTFQILPTMKVNDKVSMSGDIRIFKEAMWGTGQDDGTTYLDFDKIWMDYMSPVGKIRVGRVEIATFGGSFLNSSASGNRIMWWPSFVTKPWELLLFTQKSTEGDGPTVEGANAKSDADTDVYKAYIAHTSDAGKGAIEYIYTRNANSATLDETGEPNSLDNHSIGLWGKYKLSNFTIEAEAAHKWGDASNTEDTMTVTDWDAWAAMLDVTANLNNLNVGLMYFYASGDSQSQDSDNEAAMSAFGGGTGDDFMPLYILTGDHTGILNDDRAGFGDGQYAGVAAAGVHAFILHADYKVSDKLTLKGSIAYAQADEETQVNNAGAYQGGGYAGRDDEYGWEYNIGAAYKLLDNLTYEAHFGYLDTGDFFKSSATNDDVNEITLMSHHLTMTF